MATKDHSRGCTCRLCRYDNSVQQDRREARRRDNRQRNWSPAYGGGDADGNPVTVSFGENKRDNETLLADGDQSEGNFFDHDNHDHFGSGNGPNNNGTRRGKYTGRGS